MKVYASYEDGYKEQQVAIKETAQTLITEAITARLKDGKITADELARKPQPSTPKSSTQKSRRARNNGSGNRKESG